MELTLEQEQAIKRMQEAFKGETVTVVFGGNAKIFDADKKTPFNSQCEVNPEMLKHTALTPETLGEQICRDLAKRIIQDMPPEYLKKVFQFREESQTQVQGLAPKFEYTPNNIIFKATIYV